MKLLVLKDFNDYQDCDLIIHFTNNIDEKLLYKLSEFGKQVIIIPQLLLYCKDSEYNSLKTFYEELCDEYPLIHFLDNDSFTFGGYNFIGSLLWTNFSLFGDNLKIRKEFNQLHYIPKIAQPGNNQITDMTPTNWKVLFNESFKFINDSLKGNKNNIILTGFGVIKGDGHSPLFSNDMGLWISENKNNIKCCISVNSNTRITNSIQDIEIHNVLHSEIIDV